MKKNENKQNGQGERSFFDQYSNVIFWVLMAATTVVSLLLFNFRIDEGGDDSTYICRAIDLLNEGRYPSYQGPLYPMFLSVVIALFGTKLAMLKTTSLLFIIAGQIAFYKILKGHIGIRLLFGVLLLLSVNSWYLFFASQTYNEALFILLQYLLMGAVIRFESKDLPKIKNCLTASLPSGLLTLACLLTRSIGWGLCLVNIAYLCIRRQYRKALAYVMSVAVFFGVFQGVKTLVWGDVREQSQLATLLQVDPYDPADGQETVGGFAKRFFANSELYVSKHFMRIVGFKDPNNRETSVPVTVFVFLLFGYGCYCAFRRNKYLLYMALCSSMMLGMTFVILQTIWDQQRLIIPYVPMAMVVLLFGARCLFNLLSKRISLYLCGALVGLVTLTSFSQTRAKIDLTTLRQNFKGDIYCGYTPDWVNYLSMCEYAAANLPEGSYVACRKPNMARIYGNGQKFYGIYTIPSEDPDELMQQLRDRNVTHIILASLRRDPLVADGQVINTIHRYMNFVVKKYPAAFLLRYQQGSDKNEPAYLFEIDYDYVDRTKAAEMNNQESQNSENEKID